MGGRKGFTPEQRHWIRDRDGNRCVLCGSKKELQVHHVVPFRFATLVLGWSVERANLPTNGATVCSRCHIGKKSRHPEDSIHPDTETARRLYSEDRNSYIKMQRDRDKLCRNRQLYWNPVHDFDLAVSACINSLRFVYSKGDKFSLPWDFEF